MNSRRNSILYVIQNYVILKNQVELSLSLFKNILYFSPFQKEKNFIYQRTVNGEKKFYKSFILFPIIYCTCIKKKNNKCALWEVKEKIRTSLRINVVTFRDYFINEFPL